MQVITYKEAKNSLQKVLDDVVNNADCTLITRRDAEDAVVMSFDYFNSLMETVYLMKSPANLEHLNRSIEQYKTGKVKKKRLIDV